MDQNGDFVIPKEISSIIKSMKEIGISNFHIINYIETKCGVTITTKDITKIISDEQINRQISVTEELKNYMENRGQIFIFENLEGVAGVLTVTHDEHSNLTRFSDFMVIDGTNIPNSLNWVTIPISIQGNNGKLLSDGVAFTSSESKDFYCWLISHLLMINQRLKCFGKDVSFN